MTQEILTINKSDYFPAGFPVSREAWDTFDFDSILRKTDTGPEDRGRVRLARNLAARLNAHPDFQRGAGRSAAAGELLALGILTEIMRYFFDIYCAETDAGVVRRGLDWTRAQRGAQTVDRSLPAFPRFFPPPPVREGKKEAAAWLEEDDSPYTRRELVARESLLLDITCFNPAASHYRPLYDDTPLQREAPFRRFTGGLDSWFDLQKPFRDTGLSLSRLLRAPIAACPDSVEGQLEYIRAHWRPYLPERLLERLDLSRAVLREETLMRGFGPGPPEALTFGAQGPDAGYEEYEAFSIDRDWMPNLVLLAKTVYVWLDQLSKQYGRLIQRLDQIPDEELDRLAGWGVTGLWLIGVWERSSASREIKQRMGNPEAASSAYSLYDYVIAEDLGGEAACSQLAGRAWRRGIRLASDMVPNHVGIYSKWVIEHPDWFVQLDEPPFPDYRFSGPDLCPEERVGIYIEDGYWNHSDAAVVFQRRDHLTGGTRYIYHGNDGTSMPWNDTAQLDFTRADVRQAVADTILHVARKFSVIRFDAAMTLAKKHYQRLWFPRPEDGGAIPSRAEHGMSRADFDRIFPKEFWREVVDRVAREAPDTLLLAEAFWLMEGYFVRTLGMHRVYNSAFMNMLKDEDNAKYRQTIRNVLEFSPEVLQRFVNFMNNPDEETAEAQFGKGDKYFGVCMMLVTMPGLPMFGHGQVEGYMEKYGMEYRRAYRDEAVDQGLVARHEREIFPIMRKRHIFSGARYFALYDFTVPEGWVNENVFAYSNRAGGERALIIYNNAYESTCGHVQTSTAINEGPADAPQLRRLSLAEALDLNTDSRCYYIVRDHRSGLEYLHYARQLAEEGISAELGGYQYMALTGWREQIDMDYSWGRLHDDLAGRGVPSVEEAWMELNLASIIEPFREAVRAEHIGALLKRRPAKKARAAFEEAMAAFIEAAGARIGVEADAEAVMEKIWEDWAKVHRCRDILRDETLYAETRSWLGAAVPKGKKDADPFWRTPVIWSMVRAIGAIAFQDRKSKRGDGFDIEITSGAWLHEWYLSRQIARALEDLSGDGWEARREAALVRICLSHTTHLLMLHDEPWGPALDLILRDPDVRFFLGVNQFGGRYWINREQLARMLHMILFTHMIVCAPLEEADADRLMYALEDIRFILDAAEDAGYDLYRMVDSLK
jgi:glycosidase